MSKPAMLELLLHLFSKTSEGDDEEERHGQLLQFAKSFFGRKGLVAEKKSVLDVVKDFYETYIETLNTHWIFSFCYPDDRTIGTYFDQHYSMNPRFVLSSSRDANNLYDCLTLSGCAYVHPGLERSGDLAHFLGCR